MKKEFSSVAIIGRQNTIGVAETLSSLYDYLISLGIKVITEKETAVILPRKKLTILPREKFGKNCELVIVVGGDGSLLHSAPFAAEQNLPVLGINRGHLGFLTDVHPDRIDKIKSILQGKYDEELRFLLDAEICNKKSCIVKDTVLNDVVVSSGAATKLVEFSISIEGDYVCDYRADGLIIATPTGSTAYALSGGGPILHPKLDAIVIVPMFPHNLSSRPIVIKNDSLITIHIAKNNISPISLSCDGKERVTIPAGGTLSIRKSLHKLKLIHPLDYNYYATLRSKLHWES